MGVAFSTGALVLWLTVGWGWARLPLALLVVAAFLEAAFAICLGCRVFALLMGVGVIPESVCEACADISRRQPAPSRPA